VVFSVSAGTGHLFCLHRDFFCFLFFFSFHFPTGTDSERSFSGRESHRRLLRQSVGGGGGSIINGGINYQPVKPMKIAAINGKPKVTRYLSKECKFLFFLVPVFCHMHVLFLWVCCFACNAFFLF
jgi:hypothetical protein